MKLRGRALMRSLRRATLLIFVLAYAACAVHSQAPFADESKDKANLPEAIFRYMFVQYNYGPYVKVLCIQPERPLPEEFLSRFVDHKPRVVWSSECAATGAMNSVRHKKTGESGMVMSVLSIEWINGSEAEAKVEAFSDGLAANWNTLRMIYKRGRWTVKSDKLDGVS